MNAADVMTRQVITVAPDASTLRAVQLMLQNRISGLPVVDVHGRLVGMITEASARIRTSGPTSGIYDLRRCRFYRARKGRLIAGMRDGGSHRRLLAKISASYFCCCAIPSFNMLQDANYIRSLLVALLLGVSDGFAEETLLLTRGRSAELRKLLKPHVLGALDRERMQAPSLVSEPLLLLWRRICRPQWP